MISNDATKSKNTALRIKIKSVPLASVEGRGITFESASGNQQGALGHNKPFYCQDEQLIWWDILTYSIPSVGWRVEPPAPIDSAFVEVIELWLKLNGEIEVVCQHY